MDSLIFAVWELSGNLFCEVVFGLFLVALVICTLAGSLIEKITGLFC